MKRNISGLREDAFDVLVIGAGIHGACIAREAALRGLKVAIVDRADLGGATSHNSLKTLHGGLRYLQHLNLKRTLEGIREQLSFRSTLRHHTQPVLFLMPTYGHGLRGPAAMWAGLQIYNLLTAAMTLIMRQPLPAKWATLLSPSATRERLKLEDRKITGGALWSELQIEAADRALLDILADAAGHGCSIASYVSVESLHFNGRTVSGVNARDRETDQTFRIKSSVVVDATGPWAGNLLQEAPMKDLSKVSVPVSKSMNLLINRPAREVAMGLQSSHESDSVVGQSKRLYFAIPWKGLTLIGTSHSDTILEPDTLSYQESDVADFIADFNSAFKDMKLQLDDVLYCYQGLTPLDEPDDKQSKVLHHSLVVDHSVDSNCAGLFSVVGVKWTTARAVAERCVGLVIKQLQSVDASVTTSDSSTLYRAVPKQTGLESSLSASSDAETIQFCLSHIDSTMALTLADLLVRRTDDFVLDRLSEHQIALVARTMAEHYNWDDSRCQKEHEQLLSTALPTHRKNKLEKLRWWH